MSSSFFFFPSINGERVSSVETAFSSEEAVASRSVAWLLATERSAWATGGPGGRAKLFLRKVSELWLCDFRPFHWAPNVFGPLEMMANKSMPHAL